MDNVDEHDSDDMQAEAGLASDGAPRFRNKKSVAWDLDKCKPQLVKGVIRRPSTEAWKDFIPLYAVGERKVMAAECVSCHKRLNANRNTRYLNQHNQTCPARGRTIINQDELSSVLANIEVRISEHGGKFLKCSSGGRTRVGRRISASPATKETGPEDQNKSSAQTGHSISRKFDQEASCQELTKMIILHGHPLSIVEHEEMRSFAKSLNPEFDMASSTDVEEYSSILFQKLKADLHQKIAVSSHRVSLSASLFSHGSKASVKYLCLSVHFVDSDWKLQRRIIKFSVFQSSTTNLDRMIHLKEARVLDSESGPFNLIWKAIRDWGLDQKLLSLTSVGDIRSNEQFSKLKDFLNQRKCLPIGGVLYNIVCVDDVLNSIVSEEQPLLHLVGDILEKFIQAHMSSSLSQHQLIEVMTNMSLRCPQEDAKLWHKIYFGLEVLLHFKKAFPSEELLSAKDIKTVESVCNILRAFYHVFDVLCGPVCPTANIYFNELWIIRTTLEEEASTDHTELASMVLEMQEAFNKYWQNSYVWLSAPAVLDPRFKFSFIEFRLKQAFGTNAAKYVSIVRDTIWELFLEYCTAVDEPRVDRSNCDSGGVKVGGLYKDSLKDWDEHVSAQTRGQVLTELDKYLDDCLLPRKDDFDVLNWWMNNSTKYPTLSIMARDILAIPASAVHCQAALSNEGLVVHKQWCKLNIKMIEALVCIRDWIK
ncbi:unnamed protein product [Urochloa decumbens]|uniref:Transposase n=1 Tax=Urochloa decumbens TaxID=240449 RepID=A0ABC9BVU2_9POAL